MSKSLHQYIDQNQEQINQSLEAIADLKKQLDDLTQQVRVQQQVLTAQNTANKEVDGLLSSVTKLFRDLCSVYPQAAITDLAEEIQQIADDTVNNYQDYAKSSRFLSGAEDEEVETPQAFNLPLIVEALPDEDDDQTPLSSSQVEQVFESCDESTLEFVKQQLGISRVRKRDAIASKVSEQGITMKRLRAVLAAAELTSSLRTPAIINGSSG